jgi:hypothetical protein
VRRSRRLRTAAVTAALIAGVLTPAAGCARLEALSPGMAVAGSGPDTSTQAQAEARATGILRQTAAALSLRPRLDFDPSLPNQTATCLTDSATAGETVSVNRTAWLRGLPGRDDDAAGQQVLAFWRRQGYQILDYSGLNDGQPGIDAVSTDYFTVSLDTSQDGTLSLSASSPCVFPHGTPPP